MLVYSSNYAAEPKPINKINALLGGGGDLVLCNRAKPGFGLFILGTSELCSGGMSVIRIPWPDCITERRRMRALMQRQLCVLVAYACIQSFIVSWNIPHKHFPNVCNAVHCGLCHGSTRWRARSLARACVNVECYCTLTSILLTSPQFKTNSNRRSSWLVQIPE